MCMGFFFRICTKVPMWNWNMICFGFGPAWHVSMNVTLLGNMVTVLLRFWLILNWVSAKCINLCMCVCWYICMCFWVCIKVPMWNWNMLCFVTSSFFLGFGPAWYLYMNVILLGNMFTVLLRFWLSLKFQLGWCQMCPNLETLTCSVANSDIVSF